MNTAPNIRLSVAEMHHNKSTAAIVFKCNLVLPTLLTMDQVRKEQLRVGLTFLSCKINLLRVAEEANIHQLYYSTVKSTLPSWCAMVKEISQSTPQTLRCCELKSTKRIDWRRTNHSQMYY